MKIFEPDYYQTFRCLAGACPDSCCQEWDVLVDDASAEKYRSLEGELGQYLRTHLKSGEDGCYFQITDRRCPMWQQDGLCKIQAELGERGLCKVCAEFPRLRHDYGDFVELGLELSCPEAARLMLTSPNPRWLVREDGTDADVEYDEECMTILLKSREQALKILQTYEFTDALMLLLLYGYLVQEELDGGEPAVLDPDTELSFGKQAAGDPDWKMLCRFYEKLEILTPRWLERLNAPQPPTEAPPELTAMLRCCVERYWLQAVSDWDLVCRVKMMVAAALLVYHLGGDPVETAQLYSKEIDNSIENLETILDSTYTHPALTDRHLLALILSVKEK